MCPCPDVVARDHRWLRDQAPYTLGPTQRILAGAKRGLLHGANNCGRSWHISGCSRIDIEAVQRVGAVEMRHVLHVFSNGALPVTLTEVEATHQIFEEVVAPGDRHIDPLGDAQKFQQWVEDLHEKRSPRSPEECEQMPEEELVLEEHTLHPRAPVDTVLFRLAQPANERIKRKRLEFWGGQIPDEECYAVLRPENPSRCERGTGHVAQHLEGVHPEVVLLGDNVLQQWRHACESGLFLAWPR
mmetsp:Transcript_70437/g.196046  ORF Transcript_70437/g.196046 Transcript_70437/m.196046 type:complete len:243 (-) Transcript_70437:645-1373(-)